MRCMDDKAKQCIFSTRDDNRNIGFHFIWKESRQASVQPHIRISFFLVSRKRNQKK